MRLKKLIKTGVDLFKPIINWRDKTVDDVFIKSLKNHENKDILLNIPVQKCVLGVFWKLDRSNPFIKSLLLNEGKVLERYYQVFQPTNINELFKMEFSSEYGTLTPHAYVLPWNKQNPEEMLSHRKRIVHKENKRNNHEMLTLAKGGHSDFGPVSKEKYLVEKRRIFNIYNSIHKKGYIENPKRNDGGIRGYFLLNENRDWRFYITAGKHRAYALAALGYKNIPVILRNNKRVIHSKEYKIWPHVKNERISCKEALKIFKGFF